MQISPLQTEKKIPLFSLFSYVSTRRKSIFRAVATLLCIYKSDCRLFRDLSPYDEWFYCLL